MNWYLEVLKKYVVFDGRARRTEYWMFFLFNFIAAVVLMAIGGIIHTQALYYLYALGVFLPSIAVGIRRLHDTGRSGWWLLLGIVPLLGLVLLYFMILDSQAGSNEYGPYPK